MNETINAYMKHWLLTLLAMFFSTNTSAYDFKADGLYFKILSSEENTCAVTHGDEKYSGDIAIPSQVSYNGQTLMVTNISDDAFNNCHKLSSITIPHSVTKIGDSSFYNCFELTSVNMGNGIEAIGESAFEGCHSLINITIPNSVTTICDRAFANCSALTSVSIGNGVISMGDGLYCYGGYFGGCEVFSGCKALTQVEIGNVYLMKRFLHYYMNSNYNISTLIIASDYLYNFIPTVHSISYNNYYDGTVYNYFFFYDNTNLKTLVCKTISPHTLESEGISSSQFTDLEVIVPTSSLADYQAADVWKDFWKLKGGAEEYTTSISPATKISNDKITTIYDLLGHRLNAPQRGINIIDGKKVLMK